MPQKAIDVLASSLTHLQDLQDVRIFGKFLTRTGIPPAEPVANRISADPIVAALRIKDTLVDANMQIDGFAANGDKTYGMSEEQQKTLRIGLNINLAARYLRIPRRRYQTDHHTQWRRCYQTEHHKQWLKAVEAAQKEPGKDLFEQFHFFFSQLPPDIIETIPQRCANPAVAFPNIKYLLGNIEDAEEEEDEDEDEVATEGIGLNGYILILGVVVAIANTDRLQKEEEIVKAAGRILILGVLAGVWSIAITKRLQKEAGSILILGIFAGVWAIAIRFLDATTKQSKESWGGGGRVKW